MDTSTDRGGGGGEHDSEGDALGHEACEGGGGFSDCNCEVLAWISLTVLLSSCILSYSIFSLSIMQSNLAFISFRCFSMEAQQPCVLVMSVFGCSTDGDRLLMDLKTSRLIRASSGELAEAAGVGVAGGVLVSFASASGAAFLSADLFLSCSRSLQRVVKISTVSLRSFLSVASSVIFKRHASRSILRPSFSNSSFVRAGPFVLDFLVFV